MAEAAPGAAMRPPSIAAANTYLMLFMLISFEGVRRKTQKEGFRPRDPLLTSGGVESKIQTGAH
jgi:hypothetical protein